MDPFALNLRHLRSVVAVVELGTLSAAASRVGLSQPALTQGLSKLERQLARTLFERRPGGLSPTDAGSLLAIRARTAFALLGDACRLAGRRGFTRPEHIITATQARALLHVANAGGFAAAAAASGLSQPALHRAVRDLEHVTGMALIERRGRATRPTEHGRRMARGVRLAARELAAAISELTAGPSGGDRIVVGAMPLSRARLLPLALAALLRAEAAVTVEIVEGTWRDLVEQLRDGVLDLMIGALRDSPPPDVVQRPLFDDRLAVIARAGHPLDGVPAPTHAQLAAFPWIVGSTGTPLAAEWRNLFAGLPTPPAPVACGSAMLMRTLLRETDLLTLLSPDQVALEIEARQLTAIGPALGGSSRKIGLTTRADWRPTRAQSRLVTLIGEVASSEKSQENL